MNWRMNRLYLGLFLNFPLMGFFWAFFFHTNLTPYYLFDFFSQNDSTNSEVATNGSIFEPEMPTSH